MEGLIIGKDGLTIGQRIGKLRGEAGISQEELAQAIGVARSNIRNWELDQRELKAEIIIKLADCFKVTTDYMLGRIDIPSQDVNLQVACSELGLPQDAAQNLINMKYHVIKI